MSPQEQIRQWLEKWFSEFRSLPYHPDGDKAVDDALIEMATSRVSKVTLSNMVVAFDLICRRYNMLPIPIHEIKKVVDLWQEAYKDRPEFKDWGSTDPLTD